MPFAEDIRIQGQEPFHRLPPLPLVRLEGGKERPVDVLAEEDALAIPVDIQRQGTGRVPRRMDPPKILPSEGQGPFLAGETHVHPCGRKVRLIPVGRRPDAVAVLDGPGVKLVDHDPAAKAVAEFGGGPDMVDVAMGEDQMGDLLRIEAHTFDVGNELLRTTPGTRIDHDEFVAKIDDKACRVVGTGDARSADQIDPSGNRFGIAHATLSLASVDPFTQGSDQFADL